MRRCWKVTVGAASAVLGVSGCMASSESAPDYRSPGFTAGGTKSSEVGARTDAGSANSTDGGVPITPEGNGRHGAPGSPVRIPTFSENGAPFTEEMRAGVIRTYAFACSEAGLDDDCFTLEFRLTNPGDWECAFRVESDPPGGTIVEAPAYVVVQLSGREPCPQRPYETGVEETDTSADQTGPSATDQAGPSATAGLGGTDGG